MRIVIDLSALRTLPGARVANLCASHDVWMAEVLFYELMTTQDNPGRAWVFRKIGAGANPFSLVSNAGYLFGREIERGRPTDPVGDSALQNVQWVFNPRLQDPDFRPLDSLAELAAWQADMRRKVDDFRDRASGVADAFFPELVDVKPGQLERVAQALRDIAEDQDLVKRIFRLLADDAGERVPDGFASSWMGFRYLQSQLLWSLDHISRFGAGLNTAPMPRLENTFCDVEYAAIAAHADALLTNDATQARLFRLMAPDVYCGLDLPPE